jgi:hypothetical protein
MISMIVSAKMPVAEYRDFRSELAQDVSRTTVQAPRMNSSKIAGESRFQDLICGRIVEASK